MPRTPPIPITEITEEMFSEPQTNPRTPIGTSDKPFEAYEELSHQVEMTLEEEPGGHQVEMTPDEPIDHQVEMVEPGHQVEMTYLALSHQVEMAYLNFTSWYKPMPGDYQVEMTPTTKTPAQSRPQTSGGGWIPPRNIITRKKNLSNVPCMNSNTMKDLERYNEDFKKFQN